ncbi:MAG: carboxy-S-adenosyl-L-methionine synthase CmoA [Gammaproteobacteria bacterium]|nr:carboxy-S-adenosyl-L-methionine synthase CmoA [Gammaproteobacteria bacterium]
MKQPPVDKLYAGDMMPGDFVFDEKVATVFEDMIHRSVPGYTTIIAMTARLGEKYFRPGSRIFDLGCSLGAASFAIARRMQGRPCEIIAVDNSRPMLDGLEERLAALGGGPVQCRQEDIRDCAVENASVVILNFTLQFIPPADRAQLLRRIHDGMTPGGILILSEKIVLDDARLNDLYIEMYHQFKREMGYSEMEISRKRDALERVLLPETLATHKSRLTAAGFESAEQWFQCFNFASMVACKRKGR